ncbi:MAG: type pilus assembly protein PilA [Patescibacteria group bacterium]|nr:type pilus assembly protein PilA [Patescibacteria group bacterium]
MTGKLNKGFTLIELLVVIAIIGLLSSVVLASLNTARGKGANAAVKSNLNNMRAQAEVIYDNANGSYSGVCADNGVTKAMQSARDAGTATSIVLTATLQTTATVNCHNANDSWVISAPLKVGEGSGGTLLYWCVDYKGTSVGRATPLAAAATECPAS